MSRRPKTRKKARATRSQEVDALRDLDDNSTTFRVAGPGILHSPSVVSQGGDIGVAAIVKLLNHRWDRAADAQNAVGDGPNELDFVRDFVSDPRLNGEIAPELNSIDVLENAEADAVAILKRYLGDTLGGLHIEYLLFATHFLVVEQAIKELGSECEGMLTAPLRSALSGLQSAEKLHLMDAIEVVYLARNVRESREAGDEASLLLNMFLLGRADQRMQMRLHEEATDRGSRSDAGGVKGRENRWGNQEQEWEKWQDFVDEKRGWSEDYSGKLNMSHDAACEEAADAFGVDKGTVKLRVVNRTAGGVTGKKKRRPTK